MPSPLENRPGQPQRLDDAERLQMLLLISLAVEEAEELGLRRTATRLLQAIDTLHDESSGVATGEASVVPLSSAREARIRRQHIPANDD